MSAIVEALYIFDDSNNCVLEHVYRARPPKPIDLISRYLKHATPRPAILQLTDLNPSTTVYTVPHSNLLLQCTSSVDTQSLAILEFIHRVIDIFEDFLGGPLLSNKIEENYEVVGQLLSEVCDGGVICNTEPNVLKESVEVSSLIGKLFTQVGIPSSSPALRPTNDLASILKANSSASAGPAIPWRKSNVRHTSNELYVDIVETLSVIFAPSGRPLSAHSNGSIVFTSKISGVPELNLVLAAPGGTSAAKSAGISRTMQLPVFHPCVRLARWKDRPGELSFIPPDGKFMLAGYEVDLLPSPLNTDEPPSRNDRIFLPATVDLKSGLGTTGADFEARLTLNNSFPGVPAPTKPPPGARGGSSTQFSFGSGPTSGSSSAPTIDGLIVTIPFPSGTRNVTDFKPSRGDATFNFATKTVEWKVPTKDGATINGTATLTGTIAAPLEPKDNDFENEDLDAEEMGKSNSLAGYYDDETAHSTASHQLNGSRDSSAMASVSRRTEVKKMKQTQLTPRSISVSFAVKGWLPSGIKVDSLTIDTKRSKGLGEGIKPYKGVKYLTVSRKGIERRL